jgi:flavodoxin
MKKILLVYHSRSGYTRRVAKLLAHRLGADAEEIRVAQPVSGPIGYALCALEAIAGIGPPLRPSRHDPARYDTVIVGTPVWFWSLASPVRSWLAAHPLRHARVAFFCTMAGAGAERVFATMQALAKRAPVATLALADAEIDAHEEATLHGFVAEVNLHRRRRSAPPRRVAPAAHARA